MRQQIINFRFCVDVRGFRSSVDVMVPSVVMCRCWDMVALVVNRSVLLMRLTPTVIPEVTFSPSSVYTGHQDVTFVDVADSHIECPKIYRIQIEIKILYAGRWDPCARYQPAYC